jgi:hypothetical protein
LRHGPHLHLDGGQVANPSIRQQAIDTSTSVVCCFLTSVENLQLSTDTTPRPLLISMERQDETQPPARSAEVQPPPLRRRFKTTRSPNEVFFDPCPPQAHCEPHPIGPSGSPTVLAAGAAGGSLAQAGILRIPGRTNPSHDREPLGRIARLQRVDRGTLKIGISPMP